MFFENEYILRKLIKGTYIYFNLDVTFLTQANLQKFYLEGTLMRSQDFATFFAIKENSHGP